MRRTKEMKKYIILAMIGLSLLFNGCENMDIVDWHWTFNKARIKVDDGKWEEVNVKSWHDYDGSDMIAIETKDRVYVTHSMNIVLIKEK